MDDQTKSLDSLTSLSSRKVRLACISLVLIVGVPIVYKLLEISDSITLAVLGAVGSVVSVYMGVNVWQKKVTDA